MDTRVALQTRLLLEVFTVLMAWAKLAELNTGLLVYKPAKHAPGKSIGVFRFRQTRQWLSPFAFL